MREAIPSRARPVPFVPLTRRVVKLAVLTLSAVLAASLIVLMGMKLAEAAFPGENGKIAFTSTRDPNPEVYVMDANGSNQTRLTNNGANIGPYDTDPDWGIVPGSNTPPDATFTVNSTGDASDGTHGDGVCDTAAAGVECTLRAAIEEANATTNGSMGPDTIKFSIPGSGVRTISPSLALPDISDSATIDGSTQTGFSGSPIIELNGASAGSSANGLRITAPNSTVRGLAINRFSLAGIELMSDGNTIVGNHIGTNASGTTSLGNLTGVNVRSSNNRIGGTKQEESNVISGNSSDGLAIQGCSATGNQVKGSKIGTNAAGSAALPNGGHGALVDKAPANAFGGASTAAGKHPVG